MQPADYEARLATAERKIRRLVLVIGLLVVLAVLGLGSQVTGARTNDVLTARGLVIVDEADRARVVIGAPAGAAYEDARLVQATGMVVLDTLGRLVVTVGSDPPLILDDGTLGTRIGSSNGLTFYDPRDGKERGGLGAFEDGRANVCLDYGSASKEAVCMSVAPDDQYTAVMLNGTPREEVFDRVGMYVGADGLGILKAFGGVNSRDGIFIRAGDGMPKMTVYDSTQSEVMDLVDRTMP